MPYPTTLLLQLAESSQCIPLRQIARRADVIAAFRVTVYHNHNQTRHTISTLYHERTAKDFRLEVVYHQLFRDQPLRYRLDERRYEAFVGGLRSLRFDHMTDQDKIPMAAPSVWLVERVAAGFYHSVALSPYPVDKTYSALVNLIDAYLPEAVRDVPNV